MKNIIYFIFLLSISALSQNEKLFEEANKNYTSGNYNEAIDQYEQILKNGETSAEVYFNLANAYYKMDALGPSIFYYEKTLQLAPDDEDAQVNLEIARNATIDDLPEFNEVGFSNILKKSTASFGKNIWSVVAISCAFLFLLLFAFYYFSVSSKNKRLFFSSAIFIVIIAVISAVFVFMQNKKMNSDEYAIIFVEEAVVKNEPTNRGEDIFVLHEGSKTRILKDFQEWIEIELADGKQGWMLKKQLKVL
ncbi:MAG TPA: tetratricopeptide repeat protein [Salinimicrobium sp.]|nr:tetratricopeptide repeat protein [Salinimicrobium sp.]